MTTSMAQLGTNMTEQFVSLLHEWSATHTVEPHTPFEWNARTLLAVPLACLCALLANSAGIGGGPFYMPLLTAVLGFDIVGATALSHTIVASSAVASTLYGLTQRNPTDPSQPLIDFAIALTFIPSLLLGVGLGVFGSAVVPEWLRTLGLVALLVVVVQRTLRKGLITWHHESEALLTQQLIHQGIHGEMPPSKKQEATAGDEEADWRSYEEGRCSADVAPPHGPVEARGYLDVPLLEQQYGDGVSRSSSRGCRQFSHLILIFCLWLVFMSFELGMSHFSRCSPSYVLLWMWQTLICITFTGFMIRRQSVKDPEELDSELRHMLLRSGSPPSPHYLERRLSKVAAVMTVAGACAGLLGIGGALIFNPYLLALNVHPQVTASTSVMMILFSSSGISLAYFFHGMLNTSYAAVLAPACFMSSLVGVVVVGRLIRTTGRASIIIFILTALIAVGTVLTGIFGGMRSFEKIEHGEGFGFRPLCGHH